MVCRVCCTLFTRVHKKRHRAFLGVNSFTQERKLLQCVWGRSLALKMAGETSVGQAASRSVGAGVEDGAESSLSPAAGAPLSGKELRVSTRGEIWGRTGLFFCVTPLSWEKYPPAFSSISSVLLRPMSSMWAFQFPVLLLNLLLFTVTHVPILITE